MASNNFKTSRILVTGASGFVGKKFCNYLAAYDVYYEKFSRSCSSLGSGCHPFEIESDCFDSVIHLASKAHDLSPKHSQSYSDYHHAIVEFTESIADACFRSGIKRFVYVSSVGVYGLSSSTNPLSEECPTKPCDFYAVAKLHAEERVKYLAKKYNAEYVILRPPLVYGSGAPGNLKRLSGLCKLDIPLPLGLAVNPRTMLDLGSFCKALFVAANHPVAANKIYNIGDAQGVSTRDLVLAIRSSLGKGKKIFPVPSVLFKILFGLLGKQKMYEQLFEPYYLDCSKIRSDLGWSGNVNPTAKIGTLDWNYSNEKS